MQASPRKRKAEAAAAACEAGPLPKNAKKFTDLCLNVDSKAAVVVVPEQEFTPFGVGLEPRDRDIFAAKVVGVVPADCSVQLVCGKPGCGKNLQRFPKPQSGGYKCFGRCGEVKTLEFPPVGVWSVKGLAVVDASVEEAEAMEVEVCCSPYYCGWLPELDLPVPWSPAFRLEEES